MSLFKEYREARAYAEKMVRETGIAHGIEKMPNHYKGANAVHFSVKMLPLKKHRCGWELWCEAVEPGDPPHVP